MLEKMRQQGKPVDTRMQKLADWMDRMEMEGDGMVSVLSLFCCLFRYITPPCCEELSVMSSCKDVGRQASWWELALPAGFCYLVRCRLMGAYRRRW
jgi:hypothetical protein